MSSWDNAPLAWDGRSGQGVLWKTPLKMAGVSSPVLWGDRIFISEGDDNERALLALDAASGAGTLAPGRGGRRQGLPLPPVSDAGLALPTPACDADGVYVLFGTGDLAAFSHDGKPKWQIFLKRPEIGYGYSSSPCVSNGLVFVQFDEINGGRVLAVETATGKIRWERARSRGPAWSSPIIIPGAEGKPQFVVNANGSATAYDLAGKLVWDVDGVNGQVTPSPAWWERRVYLVNSGSRLICYRLSGNPQEAWHIGGKPVRRAQPRGRRRTVFHDHGPRPDRVRGRGDRPRSSGPRRAPAVMPRWWPAAAASMRWAATAPCKLSPPSAVIGFSASARWARARMPRPPWATAESTSAAATTYGVSAAGRSYVPGKTMVRRVLQRREP